MAGYGKQEFLSFEVLIEGREVVQAMLQKGIKWQQAAKEPLRLTAENFVAFMRQRHLSGGTTADRLAIRSGALYRSIFSEVLEQGEDLTIHVGFRTGEQEYAPAHEYGAPKINLPARMNLVEEAVQWLPKFRETIQLACEWGAAGEALEPEITVPVEF